MRTSDTRPTGGSETACIGRSGYDGLGLVLGSVQMGRHFCANIRGKLLALSAASGGRIAIGRPPHDAKNRESILAIDGKVWIQFAWVPGGGSRVLRVRPLRTGSGEGSAGFNHPARTNG